MAIHQRLQPSRHSLGFAARNPTFDYSSRSSATRDQRTVFLPDSSGEIELARYSLACPLLPCPHKDRQFLRVQLGSAKEMNMIGHDHIAADYPAVAIVGIAPFIGENPRDFI